MLDPQALGGAGRAGVWRLVTEPNVHDRLHTVRTGSKVLLCSSLPHKLFDPLDSWSLLIRLSPYGKSSASVTGPATASSRSET